MFAALYLSYWLLVYGCGVLKISEFTLHPAKKGSNGDQ